MSALSALNSVREYLTPVLRESRFEAEGVLTPEEFVAAGDLLVFKCPTWRWEAGDKDKAKPYLPPHKQYLVTQHVPCEKRVAHLHSGLQQDDEEQEEDQLEDGECWVSTHVHHEDQKAKLIIPDMNDAIRSEEHEGRPVAVVNEDDAGKALAAMRLGQGEAEEDDDSVPDMADFEGDDNVMENDPASLSQSYIVREEPDNILHTRVYDLSISYDKYYQTPRFWLFGYDEHHQPLNTNQIFEDISQDHAKKTVTMEPHPHTGVVHASIHPCRHAATMKRILSNLQAGGANCRVDQYLFLFLKFISAVIPTINYDYTFNVKGR